ncbi:hypothetical protein Tco_1518035 [Tanacetum coccineum]
MNKTKDSLVFVQAQNLQGIICVSGNEGSSDIVFPLFDVMYSQMCLCELLLLAKVRLELCFEIFVIKDATCFLTVPPYSCGVFKGIGSCWDPLSHHRNQYGKAFSVNLGESNPLSSGRRVLLSLKGLGKGPLSLGSMLPFVKVDGTCPPCGRLVKLPPIGGFPSEFAEGSPWAVH